MLDWLMRAYLLSGLIAHKALWEFLKRKPRPVQVAPPPPVAPQVRMVKLIKLAILVGIVAQTLIPYHWLTPLLITLQDATSLQLAGVLLYTLGLAIAMMGRLHLGDNWSDIETAQVLRKQAVVSRGVYRFIRHPIYVGDLLLLYGLELALNSWLVLGVVLLTPVVLRQAVREEAMLVDRLEGYADYCRATKRFIPFVV